MGMISCFINKFEEIIEEVLEQDLSDIDACELGEVVDCLKDCYEAEYYASVVMSMEKENYSTKNIPVNVRERMYFNKDYTFSELLDKMDVLINNSSSEDIMNMKQQLMEFINKL